MRILLCRTDALGDLVVSLPVMERILARMPTAEVHWLVRPYAAPLLEGLPGVAGVHHRAQSTDLETLFRAIKPEVLLNLSHRDRDIIKLAKRAGVPMRVARARGLDQILAATHLLWAGRMHSGRHEAMNAMSFLTPLGMDGGWPAPPRLTLTSGEIEAGQGDLKEFPRPRLGIATQSSGSSAFPSEAWWERALPVLQASGWNPVVLAPPGASSLPETNLRGLLGRIAACDAFLGPSTGPLHLAAALGLPVLALMGLSPNRGPNRWAPLGEKVQLVQYPGPEADLAGGMDRLDPRALLPHLDRLR